MASTLTIVETWGLPLLHRGVPRRGALICVQPSTVRHYQAQGQRRYMYRCHTNVNPVHVMGVGLPLIHRPTWCLSARGVLCSLHFFFSQEGGGTAVWPPSPSLGQTSGARRARPHGQVSVQRPHVDSADGMTWQCAVPAVGAAAGSAPCQSPAAWYTHGTLPTDAWQ